MNNKTDNKNRIHNEYSDTDKIDSGATDDQPPTFASTATAVKRHSLRSTSSFCDEVFLEELANLGLSTMASVRGMEEDAVSYGALSLGALTNGGSNNVGAAASSTMALNSIVEFDEGKLNNTHVHLHFVGDNYKNVMFTNLHTYLCTFEFLFIIMSNF